MIVYSWILMSGPAVYSLAYCLYNLVYSYSKLCILPGLWFAYFCILTSMIIVLIFKRWLYLQWVHYNYENKQSNQFQCKYYYKLCFSSCCVCLVLEQEYCVLNWCSITTVLMLVDWLLTFWYMCSEMIHKFINFAHWSAYQSETLWSPLACDTLGGRLLTILSIISIHIICTNNKFFRHDSSNSTYSLK